MNETWHWLHVRNLSGVAVGMFALNHRHAAEKFAAWKRPARAYTLEVDTGDRRYIQRFRVENGVVK